MGRGHVRGLVYALAHDELMRRGVARPANTYVQVRLGWAACLLCPCSRIVRISTGGHAAAMPHHQAIDSSRHPCARIYAVCMRSLPAPAAFSLAYPRPPLHPQPHNFGSVFTPLFFFACAHGGRAVGDSGAWGQNARMGRPLRLHAGRPAAARARRRRTRSHHHVTAHITVRACPPPATHVVAPRTRTALVRTTRSLHCCTKGPEAQGLKVCF